MTKPEQAASAEGRVRRIILDYEAGELILQVKAAHAAIRDGQPRDGLSVLSYGLGTGPDKVFAVKWNKDSVRVYPQAPPHKEPPHDRS